MAGLPRSESAKIVVRLSEDLKSAPVKANDFIGVIGEENIVSHPSGGAFLVDHRVELFPEIAPEALAIKHVGHARTDAEFHVAQLNTDLLERADTADIEDTKIGDLEPFLPEVARVFLKGVEEIDAKLRRLGFQFEKARSCQTTFAPRGFGGEAHDAAAAARENPDLRTDKMGELVDQLGDFRRGGFIDRVS